MTKSSDGLAYESAVEAAPVEPITRKNTFDDDPQATTTREASCPTPHRISLVSSHSKPSLSPSSLSSSRSSLLSASSSVTPLFRTVSCMSSGAENEVNEGMVPTNPNKVHKVEIGSVHESRKIISAGEQQRTQLNKSQNVDELCLIRFINARILQIDGSLVLGSLTLDQSTGLIVETMVSRDETGPEKYEGYLLEPSVHEGGVSKVVSRDVETVDCRGNILSPGYIDIQLNGAYGVDFSNGGTAHAEERGLSELEVFLLARRLVETGVTSFCPTLVSSSRETYRRVIPLLRDARRHQRDKHSSRSNQVGAIIMGMHLEGPFFANSKRGAHDQQYIVESLEGICTVREVYGLCSQSAEDDPPVLEDIDIITLAPELDGATSAIKSLTSTTSPTTVTQNFSHHTVVVSCGHTEASFEDGVNAISHGATLLTHLYNAMNPFHHRKPGLVGLLALDTKFRTIGLKRPFYSMIVDGIHVHESAVSLAYRSHPGGLVLVTDAMAAMGLGDGKHMLGNMSVYIKGDRATLSGTDTLAGSVVSMDTCVRKFRQFTGCSAGEALLCATLHPAKVLNRHFAKAKATETTGRGITEAPMGVLKVGAMANLILLNDELEVLSTWVRGQLAYQAKT